MHLILNTGCSNKFWIERFFWWKCPKWEFSNWCKKSVKARVSTNFHELFRIFLRIFFLSFTYLNANYFLIFFPFVWVRIFFLIFFFWMFLFFFLRIYNFLFLMDFFVYLFTYFILTFNYYPWLFFSFFRDFSKGFIFLAFEFQIFVSPWFFWNSTFFSELWFWEYYSYFLWI